PVRRRRGGRLRAAAAEHRLDRGVLGRAQPRVRHQEMIAMNRSYMGRSFRAAGQPNVGRSFRAAIFVITLLGIHSVAFAQTPPPLKIGVMLHPYYSWTR